MDSAKVKVSTSLVTVVDTKDLGETVDTLDLEYVRGKTADATKGKKEHVPSSLTRLSASLCLTSMFSTYSESG